MQENRPVYRNYYDQKDAANSFLLAVISPYIILFFALFVGYMVYVAMGKSTDTISSALWFEILASILTPLTLLAVFLIYNKAKRISFSASNVKFKLNFPTILILILVAFLCVFGLQYLIYGIDLGLDAIGYKLSSTSLPLTNGGWYVLNLFVLAFLPAVCEELIFRGIIFNGLRKNMKDIYAILLSATLFALMHASLEQFVYPFILGLVFGWLVLRTKTIVSSMIVHFLNNAIVITISFIYQMTGFDFMPKTTWLFWVLAVVLALITFGVLFLLEMFYFNKKKKVEDNEEGKVQEETQDVSKAEKFPVITFVIGISIAAILFIVNTIFAFI